MGNFFLEYNTDIKRLNILFQGRFTYEEITAYQKALIEYVKGHQIHTVLICQEEAEFPPECMEIFSQNHSIPELRRAAAAMVLNPVIFNLMNQNNQESSPKTKEAPVPFTSRDEASAYLDQIMIS